VLGRRAVLIAGAAAAGAVVGAGAVEVAQHAAATTTPSAPLPATEALLTDHGLLKRVLLIYREASGRLRAGDVLDPEVPYRAAGLIHSYIENFHEGMEEGYVFPALTRAGVEVATVRTLLVQHDRGRKITTALIAATNPMPMDGPAALGFATATSRAQLASMLEAFVTMYEHHEAWEDTQIFPAFRDVTAGRMFERISEQIATVHENTVGDGITDYLHQVERLEQQLGIGDLSRFTPPPLLT
jgi:hemerythrin-like domain-containing protein